MARYIGFHRLPGFTREQLAGATPLLEGFTSPAFLRAYTSFKEGMVVCEWESSNKDDVARVYREIGFPYDEIVEVEAICETANDGVSTRFV